MIQKKICMLGAFAVGKTSLVSRFVNSIFSERYQTTLGVKVDKKVVPVDGDDVSLVIWDLAGEDDMLRVRTTYLRGASGYILVVDSTRGKTAETALDLHERVSRDIGPLPFVVFVNKVDLVEDWDLEDGALAKLEALGGHVLRTSAKSGGNVDEGFALLARLSLKKLT